MYTVYYEYGNGASYSDKYETLEEAKAEVEYLYEDKLDVYRVRIFNPKGEEI